MKILVTGASGFVGSHLCHYLRNAGCEVVPALRRAEPSIPDGVVVGDLGPDTDWGAALSGCQGVVHLAARVHRMKDTRPDAVKEYRRINLDATLALARQAVTAGVRRFIFISTIKVNGDATLAGAPFTEDSPLAPDDAYSRSKQEAEALLLHLFRENGLPLVILRPPLIYGPGVKANFFRMIRLVDQRIPVPLGAVKNQRSLIGVTNFCSVIKRTLEAPEAVAVGECFLVSDGEDCSTPELFSRVGRALGKRPFLLPVPACLLRFAGRITGHQSTLDRLMASLQIDSRRARERLGWNPVMSMEEELSRTVSHYRIQRRRKDLS